jgi:predicted DNA-binding protein YlxM (UPF0122 family)
MAYSVKSLADKWEVTEQHLYDMIRRGDLATFKIGLKRGLRISDEEVQRWESGAKSLTETQTSPSDALTAGTLPTSIM